MTPSTKLLFYVLWIGPHVFQLGILIFLVKRSLWRQFPVFASYTAFGICEFIELFLVSKLSPSYPTYFKLYGLGLAVTTALRFGIVSEIFAHVFGSRASLRHVQKPLFRWTTVGFLSIAFFLAIYTHRADVDPRWFVVHVLDRSASIIQCGLVLALFLFSFYLDLSWSRVDFGITVGLGILCSLELALAAIRSQIGSSAHLALDLVSMGTYLCCVLIWLLYLAVPERSPAYVARGLPESDLEVWNQELERLLQR
jgi:hypothetical protein